MNRNNNNKLFTTTKPTTILFLFFSFLLILSLLAFIVPLSPPPYRNSSPESLFLSSAVNSNSSISALLKTLTLRPHLAGTPSAAANADKISSLLKTLNLRPKSLPLRALLSFPLRRRISTGLLNLNLSEWTPLPDSLVGPFHAYSPSAAVRGGALFANLGRPKDYRDLKSNPKGCVVLVRRGASISRAEVIREAENRGALAVLTFSGPEFPDGFERGTVARGAPGDPASPGWSGGERLPSDHPEVSGKFPKIPSMPVSFHVAVSVLETLGGDPLPRGWRESLGSAASSVTGVGPGPTILDFDYQFKFYCYLTHFRET